MFYILKSHIELYDLEFLIYIKKNSMKFVRKFEEFRFNAPSKAPNRPEPETLPAEPRRPVKPQEPVEPAKPEQEEGDEEYTIERPGVDPDPMAKKKEDEQLNKVVKRFLDESNKKKK